MPLGLPRYHSDATVFEMITLTTEQLDAIDQGEITVLMLHGDRVDVDVGEVHRVVAKESARGHSVFVHVVGVQHKTALEAIQELKLTVDHVRSWIPETENREGSLARHRVTLVQFELMRGSYDAICGPGMAGRLDAAYVFLFSDS